MTKDFWESCIALFIHSFRKNVQFFLIKQSVNNDFKNQFRRPFDYFVGHLEQFWGRRNVTRQDRFDRNRYSEYVKNFLTFCINFSLEKSVP